MNSLCIQKQTDLSSSIVKGIWKKSLSITQSVMNWEIKVIVNTVKTRGALLPPTSWSFLFDCKAFVMEGENPFLKDTIYKKHKEKKCWNVFMEDSWGYLKHFGLVVCALHKSWWVFLQYHPVYNSSIWHFSWYYPKSCWNQHIHVITFASRFEIVHWFFSINKKKWQFIILDINIKVVNVWYEPGNIAIFNRYSTDSAIIMLSISVHTLAGASAWFKTCF